MTLLAPFPWFGGKSRVTSAVWQAFGDVQNFVDPFFGSGAVLLARPHEPRTETINDLDCMVANFWRATQHEPDAVAEWADNPVSECDLSARHLWLVARLPEHRERMACDPDYYDTKIAGWWVWGLCCWIGSGWCSGRGPWIERAGRLVKHLGDAGQGVNRQLPHLGNGQGVNRQLPDIGASAGAAIGRGIRRADTRSDLRCYFAALRDRFRNVRVCCGDWTRVLGPCVTSNHGITGVFLDPPYSETEGDGLYSADTSVAAAVREWAIANGDNPKLRIALCGYDGEHKMPPSWRALAWKAKGGYAGQSALENVNARRERVWFSPHCLGERQPSLFARTIGAP